MDDMNGFLLSEDWAAAAFCVVRFVLLLLIACKVASILETSYPCSSRMSRAFLNSLQNLVSMGKMAEVEKPELT